MLLSDENTNYDIFPGRYSALENLLSELVITARKYGGEEWDAHLKNYQNTIQSLRKEIAELMEHQRNKECEL